MNSAKSCKVIAYFSIIPLGIQSTSLGSYVAAVVEAIDEVEGLTCEVTPMGTIMEADSLETIFEAVKAAHKAIVDKGVVRVESTLIIDDRRDKPRTMKNKVNSVKKHMKQL
ncbi:MAG TPA: MTH1187 family thiamine-binding protein [Candidatus Bathyarchaeota archaeon]|nr:MTH1187 family thiamine-binding protein [Candidatus Bathyarchaeota archaeon]